MELINKDRIPREVKKDVLSFLENSLALSGDNIKSVFLYGSIVGDDFNSKTSDINIGFIVRDLGLEFIKPLLKTIKAGIKKNINAPLLLTDGYVSGSLDTFPMEFADIKQSYCVLFGTDPFKDISIDREDLRRECEYQLKGKLITIRQAYMEQALNRKGLEKLIKASLRALFPVFKSLIRLKSGGEDPPARKEDVIKRVGSDYNVEISSFMAVLSDKNNDGRIADKDSEEFLDDFLQKLTELSDKVDELT